MPQSKYFWSVNDENGECVCVRPLILIITYIYIWNSNILRWFQFIWNIIARQTILLLCITRYTSTRTQCIKFVCGCIQQASNSIDARVCILFCVHIKRADLSTICANIQIQMHKHRNGNVRTHSFNTSPIQSARLMHLQLINKRRVFAFARTTRFTVSESHLCEKGRKTNAYASPAHSSSSSSDNSKV